MARERNLPPPTPSEAAFTALLTEYEALSHDHHPEVGHRHPEPGHCHPEPVEGAPALRQAPHDSSGDAEQFLDELYARRAEFLDRDPYATIGDATSFNTKIVGVTFEGRQDTIAALRVDEPLALERQPDNPYDSAAIAVRYGALQLGFLKREIAARVAPKIDAGERYSAYVTALTGGGARSFGINIRVSRERAAAPRRNVAAGVVPRDEVLRALIGEREMRQEQREVIARVDAGRRTLAIFGTGRGKSLCFQYPAAVGALERGEKTIVLYPLRALANDQFEALTRRLGPLGVRIYRANGSIDAGERAALNEALAAGEWDLLCATPEFVQFHLDRFADASRPSLVVVDEAHHIAQSTHRGAYQRLGTTLAGLGNPRVLALTATADDEAFARICAVLGIEAWVIDPTIRANLHITDARGTTQKLQYLERLVREGERIIVYCNSRTEATTTAEKLRKKCGEGIAFYHAGVGTPERAEVERLFRQGTIRVVVATSAFGEGIDLPDVRHVVLYHLAFDFTEFNQQSGRAGRDGADASIHLLFGENDRRINDFIIERAAPTLETLRRLYAALKRIAMNDVIRTTYADLATTLDFDRVDGSTISTAFRIFADAGLVTIGEDDDGRFVRFLPVSGKVDLTATERYAEGEAERAEFALFCEVALKAPAEVVQALIDRPIYPSGVPLKR